ncbi:MAG TPA: MliC family protein [Burkholderiales bacterium]|nr:MliC family protein [Burkholderiales bacterium]
MNALLVLAGCATGVSQTVLPQRVDYSCAGNKTLQVARAPDALTAGVLVEGRTVNLRRADSAAQEKYTDGDYSLYLDGERAMLEFQGRVLFGPCLSAVPLPAYPRQRY